MGLHKVEWGAVGRSWVDLWGRSTDVWGRKRSVGQEGIYGAEAQMCGAGRDLWGRKESMGQKHRCVGQSRSPRPTSVGPAPLISISPPRRQEPAAAMDVGPPPERPPDPEVTPHKCGAGMWGGLWGGRGGGGGPFPAPHKCRSSAPQRGVGGGGGHLWGAPHLWGTRLYLWGGPHLLMGR